MAKKKETPEEKLLRLIETPTENIKDSKIIKRGFRFDLAWIKKIGRIKERFKPSLFNLKNINRVLVVLSFIITAYLIFDFIKERPDINQIYSSDVLLEERRQEARIASRTPALNLSDYLSEIDKRDIFHFIPVKKEEKILTAKEILISRISNLKLVGIIWGKSPQAMIENTAENKTLLLNQGDNIGELKIKQILRDRVILGYEDQEMELM